MTHEEFRHELELSKEKGQRMLFEKYCGYVYTIVHSRLRSCASREDIEECVCDVFADIYLSYDPEREMSGSLSGFVGTVARRRSVDLYRKLMSGKKYPVSADDEMVLQIGSDTSIESEYIDKERKTQLLDIITELGEPDSVIVVQRYFYDRSYAEIAGSLSMTPGAVRARCARALKRLRKMLEKSGLTL